VIILLLCFVPDVSASCITLTWTAPGDDGDEGRACRYDLRYSQVRLTDSNWESVKKINYEPKPERAGSLQQCTVSGLEPGVTYWFAIKTVDYCDNWSEISNVVMKTAPYMEDCVGITGNVDCDPQELINGADLALLIQHLFIDLNPICCHGEANVSGDQEGTIDTIDLSILISHLFIDLQPLPSCQ